MRCQITATVPFCIYLIEKLTQHPTQGTLGSQSDCGIERGVPTTIINLDLIMDPVAILLLFNITVWLYWTVK